MFSLSTLKKPLGTRLMFRAWLDQTHRISYTTYSHLAKDNRKAVYAAYQKARPQFAEYLRRGGSRGM